MYDARDEKIPATAATAGTEKAGTTEMAGRSNGSNSNSGEARDRIDGRNGGAAKAENAEMTGTLILKSSLIHGIHEVMAQMAATAAIQKF